MAEKAELEVSPEKTPEQLAAEKKAAEEVALLEKAKEDLDSLSKEDLAAALLSVHSTKEQISARLTKALEDPDYLEWKKQKKEAADANKNNKKEPANVSDEIDLRFLQRDGASEEDINQLKFIQAGAEAQGKEISLIEAKNNPLYKAYEAEKTAEETRKKAALTPGGGSGFSENVQKVADMTEKEHKDFAKKKADKILNGGR